MDVHGKIALITGGGNGIGRATALALASKGAIVAVADLNREAADRTRELIRHAGGRASSFECDVTRDESVAALGDDVERELGPVDILMNNAGGLVSGPLEAIPLDDWRWMFELNALSHVRTVQRFLPGMMERRSGWIVNTSSVGGLYSYSDDIAPYIMSKFAATGFSEALALYARPHGVGVSLLCPNKTLTDFRTNARLAGTDDTAYGRSFVGLVGATPETAGQLVVAGIEDETYLLLTHPEDRTTAQERLGDFDTWLGAYSAELAALPHR